ncbi:MAG: NupC/NupG family nucleoside CNT transporter [Oceanobacter sp.]
MLIAQALLGLLFFILIAWLVSESRSQIRPMFIVTGLASQLVLAFILLKIPGSLEIFEFLTQVVTALQDATRQGTAFVFGYLGGGPAPFESLAPQYGFVLTFQALPLLMVMSALSALLFHWRILPALLKGLAWLLRRSFRIQPPLALAAAANVFVGMTEAPLLIRPYLANMTRNELFALMVTGMATIAGTVMVLYVSFLESIIPNAMQHILTASLISAPASLLIAHIMVPGQPEDLAVAESTPPQITTATSIQSPYDSSMDAVTQGTLSGLQLWLNVMAMLLVLVALVALANMMLGALPALSDGSPVTLEKILGWLMAPIAWLTGIPWREAMPAGELLGVKTVLNEMLAYLQLIQLPDGSLSERSRIIVSYALCGFANIASLGILLGGLTYLAPERRSEIVALGWKSLLGGTLATLMTASVAGIVLF